MIYLTKTETQSLIQYTVIADTETGEVWKTEPKDFKEKRIIDPTEKPVTVLRRTDDRKFISIKVKQLDNLVSELTAVQLGYMLLLSSYQRYDTGLLYLSDDAKLPLTVEDVGEVIDKTLQTAQGVVDKLISKSALSVEIVKYNTTEYQAFKVNDQFFYRGKASSTKDTRDSIKQYIEEIRQVYAENGAAATGWLGKLIPYIDRQTNFICFNPDREYQYDDLDAMSRADIEKVTGTIKRDVANRIRGMKIHGYHVFAEVVTGERFRKIKVNPLIYCRMSGDVRETVLRDFTVRGKL